jgi:hypothetical protein
MTNNGKDTTQSVSLHRLANLPLFNELSSDESSRAPERVNGPVVKWNVTCARPGELDRSPLDVGLF